MIEFDTVCTQVLESRLASFIVVYLFMDPTLVFNLQDDLFVSPVTSGKVHIND